MLWLLRLFPQFRDLESLVQVQAETIEKSESSVRADLAYRDKEIQAVTAERDSFRTDLVFCRQANQDLTVEKLRLQDRLDSALSDKDHLWGIMQEALDNERYAMRMQVNFAVQPTGAGTPYPDAPSLPAHRIPKPQEGGPIGRSGRQFPSAVMFQQERDNLRQYAESVAAMIPEE